MAKSILKLQIFNSYFFAWADWLSWRLKGLETLGEGMRNRGVEYMYMFIDSYKELTHYQTTNFRLFQIETLQTTILNFMKKGESYPNR